MQISIKSQEARILNHLSSGKSVTALSALEKWGCFRLAARIYDLRKAVQIESVRRQRGSKAWVEYRLAK